MAANQYFHQTPFCVMCSVMLFFAGLTRTFKIEVRFGVFFFRYRYGHVSLGTLWSMQACLWQCCAISTQVSTENSQHQSRDINSDTSEWWWYLKLSVKEGCVPATKKTGLIYPRWWQSIAFQGTGYVSLLLLLQRVGIAGLRTAGN